jgi:RNA polymerase sigma-70 factor (ECF subfamily)
MTTADERKLVIRAQQGDLDAFGELVQRHQTAVFNVAYRMFGEQREAEDAAQETFLRAFRAFASFDSDRPLAPWLKRIATNLCLNWLASARVKPLEVVTDLKRAGQEEMTMDRWPSGRPTPEQRLAAGERVFEAQAAVRAALLKLPPHYRAVIELRHFQNLRYDEIAATLERPLSSVKSDLYRARRQLAELLTKEKAGRGSSEHKRGSPVEDEND